MNGDLSLFQNLKRNKKFKILITLIWLHLVFQFFLALFLYYLKLNDFKNHVLEFIQN